MSGDERPTIVVSAVAMVRDGQVLTVRKRGTCRFMLPGGKWEPGEEPDDAAIREVREELGLVVEGVQLLGVFEADAANEPGHLVRSHVFVAQLPGEPQIAAEIEELRWVALDAAPADDLAPLTKRLLPLLARRNPVAQPSLADQFRHHFGHHEHLYGVLLDHLADDLDAGGATARICRDKLSASRGDAIQLRLLAAIYRIVLRGEAPELVRFYPALGGTEDPALAWPYLRPLLTTHEAELRAALDLPPQTNEVGRSAGLIIALFEAVRRSVFAR
jgi:8-oxo-dGTP pyrophosphatase MutT (NUDIX family)